MWDSSFFSGIPQTFAMAFDLENGLVVMSGGGEKGRRGVKTVRPDLLAGVKKGAVGGAGREFERVIQHVRHGFSEGRVAGDSGRPPDGFARHERVRRRAAGGGRNPFPGQVDQGGLGHLDDHGVIAFLQEGDGQDALFPGLSLDGQGGGAGLGRQRAGIGGSQRRAIGFIGRVRRKGPGPAPRPAARSAKRSGADFEIMGAASLFMGIV